MTDEAAPEGLYSVEIHGLKWDRCRRCRRLRPLQRLAVPDGSIAMDASASIYQYECRDRGPCDSVRRALERLSDA